MNTRQTIGWLIALAGAGGAVWLWRRNQAATPAAGASTPAGGLSIQRFGSEIREDSTPEVIAAAFAAVDKVTERLNCWTPDGSGGGKYFYRQQSTGQRIGVAADRVAIEAPTNLCGR